MPGPIVAAAAFLGTLIGSFLNVCIYRLPRGESLVRPPSHCPACMARVRPRDNVPIVSYCMLRGRCRDCGERISPRYAAVEAVTGALAAICAWRFGPSWTAVAAFAFLAILLVVVVTDYQFYVIPNEMTGAGLLLGIASVPVLPVTWQDAALGLLLGVGVLGGLAFGYYKITGRDGMGGGDVKLAAVLGVVLGASGVMLSLFIASLIGTLVALAVLLATRRSLRTPIPFGVFLAPAAGAVLLVGPSTILARLTGAALPG
jgi:leader peptidase (prepilin peptidase)/N-methyltransferase